MSACPCCSLLCHPDASGKFPNCSIRDIRLSNDELPHQSPTFNGKSISFDEAIERIIPELRNASHVLVTGEIVCLETSRAAIHLARILGAYVDLESSDDSFDWIQVVQEMGCTTTTITEARYRSDFIVYLHADSLMEQYPLLFEQLVSSIDEPAPQRRKIVIDRLHNEDASSSGSKQATQQEVEDTIYLSEEELYPFIKSCCSENRIATSAIDQKASALRDSLHNAKYPVIVFGTAVKLKEKRSIFGLLNQLVSELSKVNRIHLLALQTQSNAFHQVCTWLTGFPGRIQFIDGQPVYRPEHYKADKIREEFGNSLVQLQVYETHEKSELRVQFRNSVIRIPIARVGVESEATMCKADLSIWVRTSDVQKSVSGAEVLARIQSELK